MLEVWGTILEGATVLFAALASCGSCSVTVFVQTLQRL